MEQSICPGTRPCESQLLLSLCRSLSLAMVHGAIDRVAAGGQIGGGKRLGQARDTWEKHGQKGSDGCEFAHDISQFCSGLSDRASLAKITPFSPRMTSGWTCHRTVFGLTHGASPANIKCMAHSFLVFDFGGNEDAAQQARHRIDGWKQGFRLDKKLQLKFDRKETEGKPAAASADFFKSSQIRAKGKASQAQNRNRMTAPPRNLARLLNLPRKFI